MLNDHQLYVSYGSLRCALAGDTEQSLRQPLSGLQLPWRLESRTGDSKASLKARQLKRLPTAMVTTPGKSVIDVESSDSA